MNNLEKYIFDLSPSCWLNSQHINGYGSPQPSNGDFVYEWKDISGNEKHAVSINYGIFIDHDDVAITQNNLPALQVSNNQDLNEDYLGSEFRITGISQEDNDFTCIAVGSAAPSRFNSAFQIINRFSIYGDQETLRLNRCGNNVNDNAWVGNNASLNIHNLFYIENYGKYLPSRPFGLKNLLNQVHSLFVVAHTFDDLLSEHRLYDQKYLIVKQIANRTNSLEYEIVPFGNSLSPVVTGQPFNKRHGIGQEFVFWNRKLNLSEVKQVQSYIKQKYNI